MLFMGIGFDMIVYTLTEIFHSDLQQISIFTVFRAFIFLRMSHAPVPVLANLNHAAYSSHHLCC